MGIVVPKHITRPQGGRECVAAHHALDMSAWIMTYNQERLVFKGKVVEPDGQKPRDAVFAYRRGKLQSTIGIVKALYKVDLTP